MIFKPIIGFRHTSLFFLADGRERRNRTSANGTQKHKTYLLRVSITGNEKIRRATTTLFPKFQFVRIRGLEPLPTPSRGRASPVTPDRFFAVSSLLVSPCTATPSDIVQRQPPHYADASDFVRNKGLEPSLTELISAVLSPRILTLTLIPQIIPRFRRRIAHATLPISSNYELDNGLVASVGFY